MESSLLNSLFIDEKELVKTLSKTYFAIGAFNGHPTYRSKALLKILRLEHSEAKLPDLGVAKTLRSYKDDISRDDND